MPVTDEETGGSLHDKLSAAGAPLLLETLRRLEEGTLERIPQEGETCYAGMLKKSMGKMDWTRPAEELERLVRGLNPWPSAYTFLGGKMLKIWSAQVEHAGETGDPGQVVKVQKDGIGVMTGDGILMIRELQPEGKKRMSADAYLRGYPVKSGMRLE